MATPTTQEHDTVATSHPKSLLALSPELIVEIASHVASSDDLCSMRRGLWANTYPFPNLSIDYHAMLIAAHSDLSSLRLVCRYLSQVLEHHIFKSLTLNFHVRWCLDPADIESQLSNLALGASPACRYATFLLIKHLNPITAEEDNMPRNWLSGPSGMAIKARRIMQSVDTHLLPAIQSFRNLRSVAWNIMTAGDRNNDVVKALSSLSSLEDVKLSLGRHCGPSRLLINRFHNLRRLTVSFDVMHDLRAEGYKRDPYVEIIDQISDIISQSPSLCYLSVVQRVSPIISRLVRRFKRPNSSLCNLMKKCSSPKVEPNIESLHLALQDLTLDPTLTLRLRCLKSLRVEDSSQTKLTGTGLWEPLAAAQIHLQEITVSQLSKPLLTYLASYSGLKRLHILLTTYPHRREETYDTDYFLRDILPLHSLSPRLEFVRPDSGPLAYEGMIFEVDGQKNSSSTIIPSWSVRICLDSVPAALSFVLDAVTQSPECLIERLHIQYSRSVRLLRIPAQNEERNYAGDKFEEGKKWISDLEVTDPERYPMMITLPWQEYALRPVQGTPGLYIYHAV